MTKMGKRGRGPGEMKEYEVEVGDGDNSVDRDQGKLARLDCGGQKQSKSNDSIEGGRSKWDNRDEFNVGNQSTGKCDQVRHDK